MNKLTKMLSLFLCLFILGSCNQSKTNQNQPSAESDEQEKRPQLAHITNSDFRIQCEPANRADHDPPQETNLLLISEKLTTPVLIATEPSCTDITDAKAFNMPGQTAFAKSGYYAGGGYYYYGLVQNDTLKIFRQWIEEPHPDNDSNAAQTEYVLFKTLTVRPTGHTTVETHNNNR